jgi:hypothetical protein
MAFLQQVQGLVQRFLPAPVTDQNPIAARTSRYGDLSIATVTGKKQFLADEGSFFITTNPTPGTPIAGTVSATYSNTAPMFIFQNLAPVGGPRAYLDYLKIIPTTLPLTGTNVYLSITRDQIATAITVNHVTQITPVNANGDSNTRPNSVWQMQSSATASAISAPSPQSAILARGSLSSGIATTAGVIGDEWVFDFGATDPSSYPGQTGSGQATCPGRKVSVFPPLICAPQQQLFFYLWFPSNGTTGLSYEFEACHWER